MLNANGIEFRNEQGIFPLIVFEKTQQSFRCIGTTFFINGLGIFVTAKHVFSGELQDDRMIFVLQCLSDKTAVSRIVTTLCLHPFADIAVGQVGVALDPMTAQPVNCEIAPNCRLALKKIETGTKIMGFGYPKTAKTTQANLTTFNFLGTWSTGVVEDFHPLGFSNLKNKCYQTNMRIESGCSGGPVFKEGLVVGINSSSFEMTHEENPISFITPMDYLLDLQLSFDEGLLTVQEIIKRCGIIVGD
ncbi:MAG: trypsin-like peptidase domain-containing protein [Chitinophagaceae bacterium]|nr:trypsin-like peptidase domain-containing protein [Chitinophagaceae bacterium]